MQLLLFIISLLSGCDCFKKHLSDKMYLLQLSDNNQGSKDYNKVPKDVGESKPMTARARLNRKQNIFRNSDIEALTKQEMEDLLSDVDGHQEQQQEPEYPGENIDIKDVTLEPVVATTGNDSNNIENVTSEPVVATTGNDSNNNAGGSKSGSEKEEKLCKGVEVMSECNARCLKGVFICRGSDLVNKVHLQKDRFFSSVKINSSTYSTTWSVPDARNKDRCTLTCPGEHNSTFSAECEKSIFDKHKEGAQPHWTGLGRTARTCKSLGREDKREFF